MREYAIEIFLMIGIKDVAEEEADEGIGSGLGAFSDIEDDELDEFGGLDG